MKVPLTEEKARLSLEDIPPAGRRALALLAGALVAAWEKKRKAEEEKNRDGSSDGK